MNVRPYLDKLDLQHQTGKATEHTHRLALATLLQEAFPDVMVTNEPKQIECGAPDFVLTRGQVPLGYIEAKDLGKSLDDPAHKEQLKRYTESLANLIFTNYLEFRLLREGKPVLIVVLGEIVNGKIKSTAANLKDKNVAEFAALLETFISYQGQTIPTANNLASQMARKARLLATTITKALELKELQINEKDNALQGQLAAFQKHLIHDIRPDEFADIYAQTVAYGMFAARLHDPTPETFSRHEAAKLIPANNPFLRKFFQHIAGYELDESIRWIVDDLADIFRAADVGELMKDYGKATQRNDPFMHFYETFLGEYDSKLRKSRGVYYTPKPVVDFIVRAVDEILQQQFGLPDGIADTRKITIEIDGQPSTDKRRKGALGKQRKDVHQVQILDPATGTGTFLAAIVQQIYKEHFANQKGSWNDYVRNDLIPRLNGFEVLMASYAMAHTKLDMVLRDSGCKLDDKRLRIYLTNSLEKHHPDTSTLFAQWLSDEANEANFIKRDTPVMVVIGNPPYSGISSNMGEWISTLIEDYKYVDGVHFRERKHWLNDDYVKFIRYGQYCIDRTGEGVLAYINNHSFLDNPTFRGMRYSLLQSFDDIYILDLHGNSRKNEISPDGSPDENVFDIQQGVSINLFVKTGKKKKDAIARVLHHDLYGERESKYQFLWDNNLGQVDFEELNPHSPQYFFVPKNYEFQGEYNEGFSVSDLFPLNVTGIVTMGDSFIVGNSKNQILKKVQDFLNTDYSEHELKNKYSLGKNYAAWVTHNKASINFKECEVVPISYRPFDLRWTIYNTRLIWRWRNKTMKHFLAGENVGLMVCRQFKGSAKYYHAFVTREIFESSLVSNKTSEIGYGYPLYLYPETKRQVFDKQQERKPNLNTDIVQTIATTLGLCFTTEKESDPTTFAPIDLLDYIYAVLYSPTYRTRYVEFLKIDFPRVPYPTDKTLFWELTKLGSQLRTLHLMESPTLDTLITGYPETGDNIVERPIYEITDAKKRHGKVHINNTQHFNAVPETAWTFCIGGYQPAQKWLKDRKGQTLTHHDIMHYQKIIIALCETDRLMQEIDKVTDVLGSSGC